MIFINMSKKLLLITVIFLYQEDNEILNLESFQCYGTFASLLNSFDGITLPHTG
jgi:hypothetical protein